MTNINTNHDELVKTMTQQIVEDFTRHHTTYLLYGTQEQRDVLHELMNSHPEWSFEWAGNGISVLVRKNSK